MIDITQASERFKELRLLGEVLVDDLSEAIGKAIENRDQGKDADSQRSRRSAARALFAYIEGTAYAMKQVAYELDQAMGSKTFTPGEIAVLLEEDYTLENGGKVKKRPAKLRTEPNLQFAFDAFARASFCKGIVALAPKGWEAFGPSVKVRDRLMHPKRPADLVINEDELEDLGKVWGWFMDGVTALLRDARQAVDSEIRPRIAGSSQ